MAGLYEKGLRSSSKGYWSLLEQEVPELSKLRLMHQGGSSHEAIEVGC